MIDQAILITILIAEIAISAILFNRLEKHYTIKKRKNNLNDWILIDSIFYNTTNNINFPIDLKKIYILLLERL